MLPSMATEAALRELIVNTFWQFLGVAPKAEGRLLQKEFVNLLMLFKTLATCWAGVWV
jgi:hypothetical protein